MPACKLPAVTLKSASCVIIGHRGFSSRWTPLPKFLIESEQKLIWHTLGSIVMVKLIFYRKETTIH